MTGIVIPVGADVSSLQSAGTEIDRFGAKAIESAKRSAKMFEDLRKVVTGLEKDFKIGRTSLTTMWEGVAAADAKMKAMAKSIAEAGKNISDQEKKFKKLNESIESYNSELGQMIAVSKVLQARQEAANNQFAKFGIAIENAKAKLALLNGEEGRSLAATKALASAREKLNNALAANQKTAINDRAQAQVYEAQAKFAIKAKAAVGELAAEMKYYRTLISSNTHAQEADLKVMQARYKRLVEQKVGTRLLAEEEKALTAQLKLMETPLYKSVATLKARKQALKEAAEFTGKMAAQQEALRRSIEYLEGPEGRATARLKVKEQLQRRLNELYARATPELRAMAAEVQKLEQQEARLLGTSKALVNTNKVLHQQTAAMRSMLAGLGQSFGSYASSTMLVSVAMYALTRSLRDVIKSGAEYQDALYRVGAIASSALQHTEAYSNALKQLDAEAMRISSTSRFMAGEVVEAMSELAMAGLKIDSIMQATASVMALAAIGATRFGEAADIATNIMMGFQLPLAELGHVVDVMATSVTNSNQTISQMGNAMSYVAPIASAYGVSLEFVAASTQVLANAGIKASRAGTGMRRIISSLFTPTAKGAAAMEAFGVSTRKAQEGLEDLEHLETAIPNLFKGAEYGTEALIETLKRFYIATDGATKNMELLKDVVDIRALPAFIQLIKSMDDGNKGLLELAEGLKTVTGASDEMFNKLQQSLKSDWLVFLGALDTIKKKLFEINSGSMSNMLQSVTAPLQIIAKDEKMIESFSKSLIGLGKALLEVLKLLGLMKLAMMAYGVWSAATKMVVAATAAYVAFAAAVRTASAVMLLSAASVASATTLMGALQASAALAGGAMAFLAKKLLIPIAVVAGIAAVINQFVDLKAVVTGFYKNWIDLEKQLETAKSRSQQQYTEITGEDGLKALLAQKKAVEDKILLLKEQAELGKDVHSELTEEIQARAEITKHIQDAHQTLKDHAKFYLVEEVAEARVEVERLTEELDRLDKKKLSIGTKDKGFFSSAYDSFMSFMDSGYYDKQLAKYDAQINKTEADLKSAKTKLLEVDALQKAYGGTDAARLASLNNALLAVDDNIAVLVRKRKEAETELVRLEDVMRSATGSDTGKVAKEIEYVTKQITGYNIELQKLAASAEKLKTAMQSTSGTIPGAVETASQMAEESLAVYDKLRKSVSVIDSEKVASSFQASLREVAKYQERIAELREEVAAAQTEAASGTADSQKKFVSLVADLGTELREVTKLYNDKTLGITAAIQELTGKFDPAISKANEFKQTMADLTSASMGQEIVYGIKSDSGAFREQLREQAKSIYEYSAATGQITVESKKAAQANLDYIEAQLATAEATDASVNEFERLIAAKEVLNSVINGSIRFQYTEDQAIEANAKLRELGVALLEAQGYSYKALQATREQELVGLSAEESAARRAIYAAQDLVATRSTQIELMEAQGKSYEATKARRDTELKGLSDEQKAIREAIYAAQDLVATRSMQIELMEAQSKSYEATKARRDTELKGLSDEHKAIREAIYAAQDLVATRSMQIELMEAQGKSYEATKARRDTELKGLSDEQKAIREAINAAQDLAAMRSLQVELLEAQGYAYSATISRREQELSGLSSEQRELKEAIYAAQDLAKTRSIQIEMMEAQGSSYRALQANREIELRGLSEEDQALKKLVYSAQDHAVVVRMRIALLEAQGKSYQALQSQRALELKGLSNEQKQVQALINTAQDHAKVREQQIRLLETQGFAHEALQMRRENELNSLSSGNTVLQTAENRIRGIHEALDQVEQQGAFSVLSESFGELADAFDLLIFGQQGVDKINENLSAMGLIIRQILNPVDSLTVALKSLMDSVTNFIREKLGLTPVNTDLTSLEKAIQLNENMVKSRDLIIAGIEAEGRKYAAINAQRTIEIAALSEQDKALARRNNRLRDGAEALELEIQALEELGYLRQAQEKRAAINTRNLDGAPPEVQDAQIRLRSAQWMTEFESAQAAMYEAINDGKAAYELQKLIEERAISGADELTIMTYEMTKQGREAQWLTEIYTEMAGAMGQTWRETELYRKARLQAARTDAEWLALQELFLAQDQSASLERSITLLETQGKTYDALKASRSRTLDGLQGLARAEQEAIYRAEDENRIRSAQTKLLNAQGEAYKALALARSQELLAAGEGTTEAVLTAQAHAAEDYNNTMDRQAQVLGLLGVRHAEVAREREKELKTVSASEKALLKLQYVIEDINKLSEDALAEQSLGTELMEFYNDLDAATMDVLGPRFVNVYDPTEVLNSTQSLKDKALDAMRGVGDLGKSIDQEMNTAFDTLEQRLERLTAQFGTAMREVVSGVAKIDTASSAGAKSTATGAVGDLLDFIGDAEAPAGYGTIYGNYQNKLKKLDPSFDLTNLTVAEVIALQKEMKKSGSVSTAMGRYQMMSYTLPEAVAASGVSLSDKFDATTQDRLAISRLEYRGLNKPGITSDQLSHNLTMEWAALKGASGAGYYDGDKAGNKGYADYSTLKSLTASALGEVSGTALASPDVVVKKTTDSQKALSEAVSSTAAAIDKSRTSIETNLTQEQVWEKASQRLIDLQQQKNTLIEDYERLINSYSAGQLTASEFEAARQPLLENLNNITAQLTLTETALYNQQTRAIEQGKILNYSYQMSEERLRGLEDKYGTVASAARDYSVAQAELTKLVDSGAISVGQAQVRLNSYRTALLEARGGFSSFMAGLSDDIYTFDDMMQDVGSSIRDSLADALAEGELDMESFLTSIRGKLAQFAVDSVFDAITDAFIKSFTAGTGNTGFLGALTSGLTNMLDGLTNMLGGGGTTVLSSQGVPLVFATGGVVNSSLSQGVYNQPTLFPMSTPGYKAFAAGTGLLGEAGPEAVLPLTRIGGDLGVKATTAPVSVNVTVNNNAGADVKAQVCDDGQGNLTIDIIRSAIASDILAGGTKVARSIESAYPTVSRGRR